MGYGFGAFGRSWGYGGLSAAPARAFSPAELFAAGEPGFWYEAGDPSANFVTTLGSTPAIAEGDTIGLALDRHAMGGKSPSVFIAAQPELLANAGFASDLSEWVLVSGFSGTEASWQAGRARLINSAGDSVVGLQTTAATIPGAWYQLEVSCVASSDGWRFGAGDISNNPNVADSGRIISGPAVRTLIFRATAEATFVQLYNSAGTTIGGNASLFDHASLKALPGNHATQPTSSLRPKFRTGGYWQFDGTDDALATDATCGAGGNTLAVKLKAPPTLGSDKVIAGVMGGGTGRFYLGLLAGGGEIAGAVGPATPSVIKGGGSVLGTDGVAILTADGATVTLYWNGAPIYQAAQSGAPSTSAKIGIGRLSDLSGYYFPGGIFEALFVQRALDPTTALALTDFWRT